MSRATLSWESATLRLRDVVTNPRPTPPRRPSRPQAEWKDLVVRAKQNKLKTDEFTSGTFTISNLGMMAVSQVGPLPPCCWWSVRAGRSSWRGRRARGREGLRGSSVLVGPPRAGGREARHADTRIARRRAVER